MSRQRRSERPEYEAWQAMIQRCTNPKTRFYKNYGGRGIQVDPEWKLSFEKFYQDVGKRPNKNFSLDRIDNNGNYELGNVRWATCRQQQNNKRSNRYIEYQGRIKTVTEWAREKGLKKNTVLERLSRGWSVTAAFEAPAIVIRKLKPSDIATIKGLWFNDVPQVSLAKQFGISQQQIWNILHGRSWAVGGGQ